MKKYYIISLLLLAYSTSFSDESGPALYELFIGTRYTDGYQLTVYVDRIGVSWDESYELCECCNGYDFEFNGSSINSDEPSEWWDGFNFITSNNGDCGNGQNGGLVTYSIYKISTWFGGSLKYFYLDYRDSRYVSSFQYPYNCCLLDIFIVFDGNSSKFAYCVNMVEWPFTQINNGSVLKIWEIFPGVPDPPEQEAFEKEFNLTVTSANNHPYLSWNNASYSITYYEVWKKKGSGNWSLKTTTTNNHYEDTSESIDLPNGEKIYVRYKIRAKINSAINSLYSNEAYIAVENYPIAEKRLPEAHQNDENNISTQGFLLKQNSPNPFNPSTQISFYLPTEQTVTLRIYDTTGKAISTLIDKQFISSGEHSVMFHGGEIASGLYFYELKTDNFRKINRMLFLK